jgi:hypothetical protein
MRHEAIRNLYANVITIDDDLGAFDANGIQVILDEDSIAAEIQRLKPIKFVEQVYSQRRVAYALEADPLFFKAQRGEATMDDWQAKVAEIKARYPKAQP